LKCYLVVTKVMGCGDLLLVGDEPSQNGKIKRLKNSEVTLSSQFPGLSTMLGTRRMDLIWIESVSLRTSLDNKNQ